MKTRITRGQAFGLEVTTTPPPPCPKEGYLPSPRPPPDIGRGLNRSLSGRSDTKVSATHQRVAGRFLTQHSCDCLCGLRPPSNQWVTQNFLTQDYLDLTYLVQAFLIIRHDCHIPNLGKDHAKQKSRPYGWAALVCAILSWSYLSSARYLMVRTI